MKRLLLFLVLSFSISSFSQNEFFPDDSAVWTGHSVQWCGQNCAYGTWLRVWVDTVSADSIVGSHSYKRLLQTYPNFVANHFALYRMDTTEQQLWWIPKDSTSEFMYFDYDETYTVGDTVFIAHYPAFYNFDQCYFNLESIDSILIDSEYFLTYEFWPIYQLNSGHACADGLTVSERLISTSFPFTSYWLFESNYNLMCYQESGVGLLGECPWNEYNFGTFDENSENRFKIYPNPSLGPITLEFENAGPRTIELFSIQGNRVKSISSSAAKIELETELSQGVYLLKVWDGTSSQTRKLIIE